jgi:hypothetical protein
MRGKDAAQRFAETFREAMEKEEAVAVYADDADLSDYEVGFVESVSDDEVVLLALSAKGEPDGRLVVPVADINRVEYGSLYTKRLELLFQYRGDVYEREHLRIPVSIQRDTKGLLEFAREQGIVVSLVDRFGTGPAGLVRGVADDYVELERLTSQGEPDGTAILMLAAIERVHIGRREEQMIQFLYRYHFGLKRLFE